MNKHTMKTILKAEKEKKIWDIRQWKKEIKEKKIIYCVVMCERQKYIII